MKQLLDFLPIAVFAGVFFGTGNDIYWATGALMVAVTLQLGAYLVMKQPIGRELKFTFWVSIIFGGLTLAFRNEAFIQWKPTIVNWAFATALIGARLLSGKNLIKSFLGSQLKLPEPVWERLNSGWAFGFFLAGALNLVVAYNFSMEFWVSYKLIGGILITLSYIMITLVYLNSLGLLEVPEEANVEERSEDREEHV